MADNEADTTNTGGFFNWKRDPLWKTAAKGVGMLFLSPLVALYFAGSWVYESGPETALWLFSLICDWVGWLFNKTFGAMWQFTVWIFQSCFQLIETYFYPAVRACWGFIVSVFETIWGWIYTIGEKIGSLLYRTISYAADLFISAIEWTTNKIWSGFSWFMETLFKVIEVIINLIRSIVERLFTAIKWVAETIWDFLTGWVWTVLKEIWEVILSLLHALWIVIKDLYSGLQWIYARTTHYMIVAFVAVWNLIVRGAHAAWSPVRRLYQATVAALHWVWNITIEVLASALQFSQAGWEGLASFARLVLSTLWYLASSIASRVWPPVSRTLVWMRRTTNALVSRLLDVLNEVFWCVVDVGSQVCSVVARTVSVGWRVVRAAVVSAADWVARVGGAGARWVWAACVWGLEKGWDVLVAAVEVVVPIAARTGRFLWRGFLSTGYAMYGAVTTVFGVVTRTGQAVWRVIRYVMDKLVSVLTVSFSWINSKVGSVKNAVLWVWKKVADATVKSWRLLRSVIITYIIQPIKAVYSASKKATVWLAVLLWGWIKTVFRSLKEWYFATSTFMVTVKSYLVRFFKRLVQPFVALYQILKSAAIKFKDVIKTALQVFVKIAKAYIVIPLYACGREVKRVSLAIFHTIKGIIVAVAKTIKDGFVAAKIWFRDVLLGPVRSLGTAIRDAFRGIRDAFRASGTFIRQNARILKDSIRRGFTETRIALRSLATQTKDAVRAAFRQLRTMAVGS